MEKIQVTVTKVHCDRCNYDWLYSKGTPQYRIRCPKCGSVKNKVNHELFGKWSPKTTQSNSANKLFR